MRKAIVAKDYFIIRDGKVLYNLKDCVGDVVSFGKQGMKVNFPDKGVYNCPYPVVRLKKE